MVDDSKPHLQATDSPIQDRWNLCVPLNQQCQRLVEVFVQSEEHIFYSTFSNNKHTTLCPHKIDKSHESHFNGKFLISFLFLIQLLIEGLITSTDALFPLLISSLYLQNSPSTYSYSFPLISPQSFWFGSIRERPLVPLPFIENQL